MPNNLLAPPAISTITVGGRVFTDLANLIMIGGRGDAVAKFCTLRKMGASAGYTPSGAKAFRVRALRVIMDVAGVFEGTVGYGDTDIGMNAAALPATPIYLFGDTTFKPLLTENSLPGTVSEIPADFLMPNTKFAFATFTHSAMVYMFGYEE